MELAEIKDKVLTSEWFPAALDAGYPERLVSREKAVVPPESMNRIYDAYRAAFNALTAEDHDAAFFQSPKALKVIGAALDSKSFSSLEKAFVLTGYQALIRIRETTQKTEPVLALK